MCPPLIAALAGAVLAHCDLEDKRIDWRRRGRDAAINLALSCTRPTPVDLPIGCRVVPDKETMHDGSGNDP